MKKLLSALFLLALTAGVAAADTPDPAYCSVLPGDDLDNPRFLGIPYTDADIVYADINITIAAYGGIVIEGAEVELVFNESCDGLCFCAGYPTYTGLTDENGEITFNLKVGGCCDLPAAMSVVASDIPIRGWIFVSPDLGQPGEPGSDCAVDGADFTLFNNNYGLGTPYGWCADFDGDLDNDGGDFTYLNASWAKSCTPGP